MSIGQIRPGARFPVKLVTPAQSLSGHLKQLNLSKMVVSCDISLPRETDCKLIFAFPQANNSPIKVVCCVIDTVYSSRRFDIYLKVMHDSADETLAKLQQYLR